MLTGYPCQTQHPAPQIQQSPAGAGLESGSCCAAAKNFRSDRERAQERQAPCPLPGWQRQRWRKHPPSPAGVPRAQGGEGPQPAQGAKPFHRQGGRSAPFGQRQGTPVPPTQKAPPERGLKTRGAEAPTVELLKPKLRRSTRRTGSRSRRRTRHRHRCSPSWDSCPRCCGCRPATWRCRQRPA